MANTLAYYDTATITAVKSFIVQAPGVIAEIKSSIEKAPGVLAIRLLGRIMEHLHCPPIR